MGMRVAREITNPELLIKWGVKGVYNEFDLGRSMCSCGHVEAGRLYVCPNCGNTEFVPVKDWSGEIIHGKDISLVPDAANKAINSVTPWLFYSRLKTDPAKITFEERDKVLQVFVERGYSYYHSVPEEQVAEAVMDNIGIFSKEFQFVLNTLHTVGLSLSYARNKMDVINYNDHVAVSKIKKLVTDGELDFLRAIIKSDYHGSWKSESELREFIGIPEYWNNQRNNPTIINAFSCMVRDVSAVNRFDSKWNKIPDDIKFVLSHYLSQGLITGEQLSQMTLTNDELLKNYPEVQKKIIKKYFANLESTKIGYYPVSYKRVIDDMYNDYMDRKLPITPESFDFRAWNSILNSEAIKELGYTETQIDKLVDMMDVAPLDSFLAIGKVKRKRKKAE